LLLLCVPERAGAQGNNDAILKRGKSLWANRGCAGCHGIGKKLAGPDLAGVEQRRSRDWLTRWLTDTDGMLASDSTAQALLAAWNNMRMPKQNLAAADVDALLAYISSESGKLKK